MMTMNSSTESQAYNIALKTLRERCQYLQKKLEVVEDENCKLKIQLNQSGSGKSPRPSDVTVLQEELILLSKENSQLNHQIQMMTGENRTLWARLSKLTAVNQTLGNRLSVISDTLSRHDNIAQSDCEIDLSINKNNKESLEEISLKLIQGILMEKTELENQYAQMVDLQNDNETFDIQNLAFSLPEQEDSSISDSVNKHVQHLNNFKQLLMHQKNSLQTALANVKNIHINQLCNKCASKAEPVMESNATVSTLEENNHNMPTLPIHEVGTEVTSLQNDSPEKICPLCGLSFSGLFSEFQNHVSGHFTDEEDSNSNPFELVS